VIFHNLGLLILINYFMTTWYHWLADTIKTSQHSSVNWIWPKLHLVEVFLELFLGVTQLVDTHLYGKVGAAALSVDVVTWRLQDSVGDCSHAHRVTSLLLGRRQVTLSEIRPLVHWRRPAAQRTAVAHVLSLSVSALVCLPQYLKYQPAN